MDRRIIYESGPYRIVEQQDVYYDMYDLLGDTFEPEFHTDIDPIILEAEKKALIRKIDREGVYGYILEKWDGDVGIGWTSTDSCFGFIGRYNKLDEEFNHYIVEEMIVYITKQGE